MRQKLKDIADRSFERRAASEQPKIKFHIITEGKKSEPNYINAFVKSLKNVPYELHIIDAAGAPKTIVEKATELKAALTKRNDGEPIEQTDKIWVAFDCDNNQTEFEAAIAQCEVMGYRTACSNPCFELWYLLHKTDFDKPETHKKIQSLVKRTFPGYHPEKNKTVDFAKLSALVVDAERRAVRMRSARLSDGAKHPMTTFDLLTAALREAAQPIGVRKLAPLEGIRPSSKAETKRHGKGRK